MIKDRTGKDLPEAEEIKKRYQLPHIYRWYHSNGRKWRGTEEPLDKVKRGEWKSWLETQH